MFENTKEFEFFSRKYKKKSFRNWAMYEMLYKILKFRKASDTFKIWIFLENIKISLSLTN
jgi:hypothetical protein